MLGENPASGAFAARRQLGYLPENVAFNGALTGRETLSFYARLKSETAAIMPTLLDRVGLGEAGTRRVSCWCSPATTSIKWTTEACSDFT